MTYRQAINRLGIAPTQQQIEDQYERLRVLAEGDSVRDLELLTTLERARNRLLDLRPAPVRIRDALRSRTWGRLALTVCLVGALSVSVAGLALESRWWVFLVIVLFTCAVGGLLWAPRWLSGSGAATAVVAAVAALLGAGLGAFATYETNKYSQDRADRRAAAADAALARGVARVLQGDYSNAIAVIDVMLATNHYILVPELTANLSYGDKKRLAATVPERAWNLIASADADLESLVQLIHADPTLRLAPLTASARTNLQANRDEVLRAGAALTYLTETKP